VNGAIYSPGTASDLARSVGVSEDVAREAQQTVAGYVDVSRGLMMWNCINDSDCDHAMVVPLNSKMSRRSIAYNHNLDIETNVAVSLVNTTHITLKNDTVIKLGSGDKIILAAGALVSPQLLNYTSFSGYNHYFILNPVDHVSEQSIEYNRPYEINRANIFSTTGIVGIEIKMLMEPTFREYHVVGQDYNNSPPEAVIDGRKADQAWHYMGTLNHTRYEPLHF